MKQTWAFFLNITPERLGALERASNLEGTEDNGDGGRYAMIPRKRLWLWIILALYLLVALGYGVINPLFEAPDEHMHYFTVREIVDSGQLPVVAPRDEYDEWMRQEAAQPPLYYLLSAALIGPIDTDNLREKLWPNKFTAMGNASSRNNINRFIHTSDETFPWRGYVLAMHLLRGLSTLLGLGTLLFIYGSGRLLWPNDPYRALLATALVAFLPQFDFLHASATNDTLIIFLVAAALWQIIRLWLDRVTPVRLLLLGVTIGLAALSKNAGIVLLLYVVGVLLLLAMRGIPAEEDEYANSTDGPELQLQSLVGLRLVGAIVLYVILPAVLLSGWLWARNWMLYGDFTATNQFIRLAGGDREYTLLQVFGESNGLWLSLFAVFGWFNLRPPDWVYWFWNGVAVLAIAGASWHALSWVRNREPRNDHQDEGRSLQERAGHHLHQRWVLPLLLTGWVLLIYASLVTFMLKTEAAQGRLLFPALIPLALGIAYGWTIVNTQRRVSIILPPLALLITLYCLFFVIRPAYAYPSTIAIIPDEATRLDLQLDEGLMLAGARVETETAEPGDLIWLTLYWEARSALETPPEFALSIFGRDFVEVAKLHSYHGRGMYPANLWLPGQIVVDRFAVRLDEEFEVPTMGRIWVSVIEGEQDVEIGEVKIVPASWPKATGSELAQVGKSFALTAADLNSVQSKAGDMLRLTVQWHVLRNPDTDFTTLVHIGQPDQTPLVIGDRPPLNGDYPTRIWNTGEVINETYTLALPPNLEAGRYPLWIGMYDSKTITRLPITVGGELQPYDVYLAGWVEVEE